MIMSLFVVWALSPMVFWTIVIAGIITSGVIVYALKAAFPRCPWLFLLGIFGVTTLFVSSGLARIFLSLVGLIFVLTLIALVLGAVALVTKLRRKGV